MVYFLDIWLSAVAGFASEANLTGYDYSFLRPDGADDFDLLKESCVLLKSGYWV